MPNKKLQLSADTSSLILLNKTNLLQKYENFLTLYVSNHVKNEMDKKADFDAALELNIVKTSDSLSTDDSVIVIYHNKNLHAVLSDDAKILKSCRKQNITHYCCLSLCAVLANRNHIPVEKAVADMNELLTYGRYSAWVIQYAFNMLIK